MFADKRASLSNLTFLGRGWLMVYAICICLTVAAIAIFTTKILNEVRMLDRQRAQRDFESLFSKPSIEGVQVSDDRHSHGRLWFQVKSGLGPLVLQPGREIHEIGLYNGMLGKKTEPWMTRCYYQPHDAYLTGLNGDTWIYTDDNFAQASITGLDTYEESREGLYPVFQKIFQTPCNITNLPEYYCRGKTVYFEVWSPLKPLSLKESQNYQLVDPQSSQASFPPRQSRESWMTKCYYASANSAFGEAIWVFMNESRTHAFVMANLRDQP